MLREAVKNGIARAGGSRIGRHAVHAAVLRDLGLTRFSRVTAWPRSVERFEDLAFLFSSNQLNHGIASLAFDEAAYLYRLVRELGPTTVVEIGRFKGGSTLLLAAALADGGELYSYDLHVPAREDLRGPELDRELADALRRYGLDRKVHLVVGDSRLAQPPPRPAGLVFVDGDHSYQGARADYERWRELLRPGGHILFHDAVDTGRFSESCEGVAKVVAEIERDDSAEFARQPGAGTIAHFRKRDQAATSA